MCYMDSLISFVYLNFSWLQCFHWLTIQPSFSTIYILTDMFFTCVTGLCVLYTQWYRSMGVMGAKAPTIFSEEGPLPTSPGSTIGSGGAAAPPPPIHMKCRPPGTNAAPPPPPPHRPPHYHAHTLARLPVSA